MQSGQDWAPRFAVYGDMGDSNSRSLALLQEEVAAGNFDGILHVYV